MISSIRSGLCPIIMNSTQKPIKQKGVITPICDRIKNIVRFFLDFLSCTLTCGSSRAKKIKKPTEVKQRSPREEMIICLKKWIKTGKAVGIKPNHDFFKLFDDNKDRKLEFLGEICEEPELDGLQGMRRDMVLKHLEHKYVITYRSKCDGNKVMRGFDFSVFIKEEQKNTCRKVTSKVDDKEHLTRLFFQSL